MAEEKGSPGFLLAFGALKGAALLVGSAGTALALASVAGRWLEGGAARWGVACAVTVVVPLLLVDRLLPENVDAAKVRGLPTDVLSVVWLGFSLVFFGVAGASTGPLLAREADRQRAAGHEALATATYWLAGVRPVEGAVAGDEAVAAGASRDAGASSDAASAGSSDAGAPSDAGSSARPARRPERTPAELFRELAPSVVTVTIAREGGGEGGGTGFLLDAQGTVATNHHVIDHARGVRVKLFDDTQVDDVEVLDEDPRVDLALLRIHTSAALRAVELGDSDSVQVGERALSIGNPLGLEHTLTDGLVSARRVWEGRPMIQMSVPVSPGNSGGPLFNLRGEVIGVTTAQLGMGLFGRGQNLNLAVPVAALRRMLRSEYPNRRRLGSVSGGGATRW